jgi:hypothetical protein
MSLWHTRSACVKLARASGKPALRCGSMVLKTALAQTFIDFALSEPGQQIVVADG